MQVDAFTNSVFALTGGQTTIGGAQRRQRLAAGAADNASRDPSQQRQSAVPGVARTRAATSPRATPATTRASDSASISPRAKSANLQSGEPAPASGGRITAGGAIVERFVRQRAVLAYQSPVTRFGSFNLTLEVESSYRVTEYIPPGGTIDVEG